MAETAFKVPKSGVVQNINQLRVLSGEAADKAQAILEQAKAENRYPTEDEDQAFHAFMQESQDLEQKAYDEQESMNQAARWAVLEETKQRHARIVPAHAQLNNGILSRVTYLHDRVLDDPQRGFAHMGEFFSAIYEASMPGRGMVDERLIKIYGASGMNQGDMTHGGALVPPSFSQAIWDGMNSSPENLMALCDAYPVQGESLTFPAATDSVGLSRYGGVQAYWIAEGEQKTATSPRLRQIRLEPQELAVVVYATDKLLRNAPALDAYIRRAATEAIMFAVNNAILFGTGTGQPLGIMNSPALVTVAAESGQQPGTLSLANINAMYARLHPRAVQGARWFINKDVEPALETLAAEVGTGGVPVFIASPTGWPNVAEPPQRRLKGLPLMEVEYCQTLGTTGDIILANLGWVALGVQGGIMEDMSIHVRFLWDETAFRFVFMVDSEPILTSPVTPFHGTNTLSAYVALAAR